MTSRIVRWWLAPIGAAVLSSAPASAASTLTMSTLTIPPATAFGMKIVALHNRVRAGAGSPPLHWDGALARAADSYALDLARTGRWGHSPQTTRAGQGENLWMGTRGAFTLDQMVGAWASEGRQFRSGTFPAISRTGSWEEVGHYTQMIWPGSLRVGCALRSSARDDYFVCRYSPAGNVMGVMIP